MAILVPLLAVAILSLLSPGGVDLRVNAALVMLSLVSLAGHLIRAPGGEFESRSRRRLLLSTVLYAAIGLFSLFWSVHPQATVMEFEGVLLGVSLLALVAYGADIADTKRLWLGVAVIGFATCVWGLVGYVVSLEGHFPVARVAGSLTYSNVFAAFAAALLLLVVAWRGPWAVSRRLLSRLWVLVGGIAAAAFIGAFSRGAALAFLPALALALWLGPRSTRPARFKRLVASFLIGLVVFTGLVLLKPAVTGQPLNVKILLGNWYERFYPSESEPIGGTSGPSTGPASGETGSEGEGAIDQLPAGTGGRLSFWGSALDIAADYPLFGTGLGTFPRMHLTYQRHPRYYATEAHSVYFQTLAETGIVGLATWLGLLACGYWVLTRALKTTRSEPEDQEDSRGLVSALGGVLVLLTLHSAVDLDMSVPAIQALFWLGLGTLAVYARPEEESVIEGEVSRAGATAAGKRARNRNRKKAAEWRSAGASRTTTATWVVVVGLVAMAVLSLLPALSLGLSRSGYDLVSGGDWERGLSRLETAESLNPLDPAPHALLASIISSVTARWGDGSADDIEAVGLAEIDRALALDSRNPNLWTQKAQFLHLGGDLEGAIAAMERAAELAPYFPEYHFRLAVLYMERGDDERSLAQVDYVLGWWDAFLLNPFAREDAADLVDDIYLLGAKAAYHAGQYDKARTYVEKVLDLDPENAQALTLAEQLAGVEVELGD